MSCGGFLTWNAVEQAVCGGTVMNEDRWIEHHQPIHLGVVSRSPHGPAGAVATLAGDGRRRLGRGQRRCSRAYGCEGWLACS